MKKPTPKLQPKIFKSALPDLKEIPMDEVGRIKSSLEALNPEEIINNALKASNSIYDSNITKIKKDDLLEQTKSKAVMNFITELKNKNEQQMRDAFNEKVDEYNKGTQVIIEKTKKEKDQYLTQYNSIKEENMRLVNQITQINNEFRKLEKQLKESQTAIYKLQTRFEIFNKHKPLFDEFIKEFPTQNPVDIMKEVILRKDQSTLLISEYNKAKNAIDEIKKEKMNDEKASRRAIDELSQKIYDLEQSTKGKSEKYQKEILSLQNELSVLKRYKDENILLHNMLFRIYNKLFDAFRLDKNVKIDDKYLNVQEKDFKPDLFNNEEISRYIEIMIADMKPVSSGKLLRETVACANMMVRVYLKDKVNLRYDPVNTFKDLKMLMESKEEKILKLSEQNKNLAIQVNQLFLEKKHLMSEIKHLQSQMSYARNRNSLPIRKKTVESLKHREPSFPQTVKDKNLKLSFEKIKNKTEHDFHTNKITKRSSLHNRSYEQGSFENEDENQNKPSSSIRRKAQSVSNISSVKSMTKSKDFLNENEAQKFKDLSKSKNNDKLYKTHGYQNLVSNLAGFKELVEHTNRLFLYKAKMSAKHKNHLKANKFQSVDKKYRPLSSSQSAVFHNRLKDDIVSKINGLINTIEKSDKN